MVGAYPWLKDPRSFLIIVLPKISIDNLLTCSLKQRPNLRPQFNLEFGIVLQVGNDITLGGGKCENISQSPSRSTLDIQFHVISTLLPHPTPMPSFNLRIPKRSSPVFKHCSKNNKGGINLCFWRLKQSNEAKRKIYIWKMDFSSWSSSWCWAFPPGPRYFRLLHHTITSREGVCTCQRPWQQHQCTLFTLGTAPSEPNRTSAPWHLAPPPSAHC